jgi:hypothetical protein
MQDEDVAELGMHEPVDGSAIEDDAGTDARAHRHVDEVRQPPSGAPALLGERRRVHILDLGEIVWAGALGAHPLRSTGFDAAEHGRPIPALVERWEASA